MANSPNPGTEIALQRDSRDLENRNVGAFFPSAHSFVVSGGTFTSLHTHHHPASSSGPSGFRDILLGDLDLQTEIHDQGVVSRRRAGENRRGKTMYSVRIWRGSSTMTAAVYTGSGAEENWKRDVTIYSGIRHPNFLQVYGLATTPGVYATVFHDELIPADAVWSFYRNSPVALAYLGAAMNDEFKAARDHFMDLFGEYAWQETSWAAWMRCSTGRLALDISSDSTPGMEALRGSPRVVPSMRLPLFGPDLAQTIISSLSLNEYHAMTMFTIFWSMPDTYTARLGGLMLRGGSQYLTYPTVPHSHISSWESSGLKQSDLSTLPNGWTRVERSAAAIGYANLNLRTIVSTSEQPGEIVDHWLSQAGCILKRLHITSDFENYAIVDKIVYRMEFNGGDTDGAPSGHLFLCPSRDFQAIDGTFQRPAIPAFWALNEDGSELLAPGDAEALGFPAFQMIMHAFAQSWPQSSYDGLREFHRGKGFDPDSQDVARHLGYPLYEMFPDYSQGFAHVDEMLDCSEPDDEDRMMVD